MYKFRGHERHGSYLPPDISTGLPWSQRPPDLPCARFTCGIPVKSWVTGFATFDIVKNIVGVGVFIYLYVMLRISDHDELLEFYSHNEDMVMFLNFPPWLRRGILFLIMFLFLLSLGFSVLVFKSAKQGNYRRLRYWFIYQLSMLLIFTGIHIWMFFYGWFLPEKPRPIIGSLFLLFFMNYLWQGYHLYVCSLLMTDILYHAEDRQTRTRFNFSNIHRETSIVSFRSSRSRRRSSWPFSWRSNSRD